MLGLVADEMFVPKLSGSRQQHLERLASCLNKRMNRQRPGDNEHTMISERGLLALAGHRGGLPSSEALTTFRELVSADIEWADSRKTYFRRRATWTRGISLVLTALSTVVLGIAPSEYSAIIALPMVATVTLLGSLELFHNWRSRWILMEETRYELNRLRDEIDFVLVTNPPDQVTRDHLDRFFADQQQIWANVSRQWVEFRRQGDARQPGNPKQVPDSAAAS
jgi:uncharacterized protein DUF4231